MFFKIDLSDAYLQIDEECSITNEFYKLNCLLFGLKVAPSFFLQIIDAMLAGLKFAIAYLDNILLKSENSTKNILRQCSRRLMI